MTFLSNLRSTATLCVAVAILGALGACAPLYGASESAPVAPPSVDNPKTPGSSQTAVIAAGCCNRVRRNFTVK